MAITTANINTGGATVYVGGTVATVDGDGFFIGTTGGTDVGCTTGGVTINYTFETSDIFCDQILSPVDTAVISETATVEFEMLETHANNLAIALGQVVTEEDTNDSKIGVGGIRSVNFVPVKLTVPDTQTGYLTTWTFYRCKPGNFSISFNRDNPSTVRCSFTAYAETSHGSGHQLFSINQALSA
jgi:hypothetical protein